MRMSNSEKINYYSIIRDVLHNWWVILLGAAASAMIGHIVANEQYYFTYTTSATFVVSSRGSDNNVYNNLSSAQTLAAAFSNVLNSSIVKKKVCEDLGLSEFSAQVGAEVISETNLLVLTVTADTSEMAYRIIRSIMENYTSVFPSVSGNAMMEVLQEPPVPQSPDISLSTKEMEKKGFLFKHQTFVERKIRRHFQNKINDGKKKSRNDNREETEGEKDFNACGLRSFRHSQTDVYGPC